MGEAGLDRYHKQIIIASHIITYGDANSGSLTEQIRDEMETMWNEAQGMVVLSDETFLVQFHITAEAKAGISELEVLQNVDPHNNYFRIEEFAHNSISFVDGLGCNTGYFLLENLYKGSTTAAHEYGHTLGLDHPKNLDIRGQGVPGIMYPRGTLVDPPYQYDQTIEAGLKGGTMHPVYRRVKQVDISAIKLNELRFINNKAIVGDFSSIYHLNHSQSNPTDFFLPPLPG